MKLAQVDDITLEYDVWGVGEPVVFIHGAFIADTFRPLVGAPSLAGGYQLVTYRRRGYGGSSPELHPRFEETYRLLLEWIPQADGFVLPGATHFLQVESASASKALAVALAGFFARNPIDAAPRQGAL